MIVRSLIANSEVRCRGITAIFDIPNSQQPASIEAARSRCLGGGVGTWVDLEGLRASSHPIQAIEVDPARS